MNSHDLARLLLSLPDLPIATYAHGYVYASVGDRTSHGTLKVGRLHHYAGDHLVLGDMYRRDINYPNWYMTDLYHGELRWEGR